MYGRFSLCDNRFSCPKAPVGGVTRYLDIAVRALATADVDQARAFVARELGPLASRDETNRRLAATVRTYLDENGSRGRAARRLNVHENTVAYRLRQAEEILGRSVDKRTLELRVALAVADLVGEAADSNRATPGANYCKPASGGVADLRDCGAGTIRSPDSMEMRRENRCAESLPSGQRQRAETTPKRGDSRC